MSPAPAVHPTTARLVENLGGGLNAGQEDVDWHLLKFLDPIVSRLGALDDLARDTDQGPGWTQLLDVDRVPGPYLPWLAQLVGVTLPPGLSEAQQRDYIQEKPGWARGSRAGFLGAIQATLTGTKHVWFLERYGGHPYRFAIQMKPSEAPDQALTERVARAAKPAGLILYITWSEGAVVDALIGTVNAQIGTVDSL